MATPNMNLTLPTVSSTPGPTWASQLNTAFDSIDAHDHTTSKGKKVPTAGLNINAALNFASQDIYSINQLRFTQRTTNASNINGLFNKNGDLYYINNLGQVVKITSGSTLNITSAQGIGGDYGTGDEEVLYTTSGTFYTFKKDNSGSTYLADILLKNAILALSSDNTKRITLTVPTISASYTLTLPAALPASGTREVEISSTGVLSIKDNDDPKSSSAGTGSWTTTSTSDDFIDDGTTDLSLSFKASGRRPVVVMLIPKDTSVAYINAYSNNSSYVETTWSLYRDGVAVKSSKKYLGSGSITSEEFQDNPESVMFVDTAVASGSGATYTYKVAVKQARNSPNNATVGVYNCKIFAFEL